MAFNINYAKPIKTPEIKLGILLFTVRRCHWFTETNKWFHRFELIHISLCPDAM